MPRPGTTLERRFLRTAAAVTVLFAVTSAADTRAADLVRLVRFKLSAGDLASAEAAVEDYRRRTGVDREYLSAVGWLARGAEMLRRPDRAARYVAEVRREIPAEKPELVVPLGAAIEVEGKLRAASNGRGDAIRFLERELALAEDVSLRSRIRKNVNLLTLEGTPAPDWTGKDDVGGSPASPASLRGSPVLLFFWANGCGDCRDQAPTLARVARKYRDRGLRLVAPTRLYGSEGDGKAVTPEEEKAAIAKVWRELFPGLDDVGIPVDTETMIRYGVSATPTFVLVDRKGTVRLYSPTRLSEEELSRRIEEVLAEAP